MTAETLLERLRGIVGTAAVLTEEDDVAPYATDWRKLFHGRPLAVVRPGATAEVSEVLRACHDAGVAVVPQGGNTGMAGGATPGDGQIVLSLTRMNRVRAIDTTGLTVEAESGAVLQTVKEAVAAEGRLLPVSLAAEGSATIGGIVATNAGGVNVLRYGMTRELVLGAEVVLADGTVLNGLRHLRKDNAGIDWKQLFIGSEGALGIVTAAVLRLFPQPRERMVALIAVPEIDAAIALFDRAVTEIGETLTAFELISAASLRLVEKHAGLKPPIAEGAWFLLIEAGSALAGLREAAQALIETAFAEGQATDGVIAESEAQAAALWSLREHVSECEAREGTSVKHDVSVPLRSMPRFLAVMEEALPRMAPGSFSNVFGHLGDGNLHVNILTGPDNDAAAINRAVHDLVVAEGGSISAEHGLGQYRLAEWQRLTPVAEQALAERIKRAIDPDLRLNPGKAIPLPPKGRS